ncbi:MAG TPA: hypothetical protein VFA79_06040 [Myxococcales bacterium]|nr:hypothetical protein [Myxococcales bacterium]
MSACDELRANAAGIASLPEGDRERETWLAHARTCPGCAEALREGERMIALLAQSTLPKPSARALRRASAPIRADLRPLRWPLGAVTALLAFGIPVLFARHRDAEGWAAALIVLLLATALSASAGALRAGAWIALAASAGFAVAAGGIPGFSPAEHGLAAHLGVDCLGIELLGGAIAGAAVIWRGRGRSISLATAAAAGALAAQAALHLTCGAHAEAPHLWVFHVGGVAAAALAGWALQDRLYPSTARS